jgi:hypothetical protein
MKKIDQIILWTLGLGFPVVVGLMIWAYTLVGNNSTLKAENYQGGVWDFLGTFFILWMILAVVTLFRLLINSDLRETVLSKVARIQERDEREVEVSGYAAKFSFFANLAMLVCLLFFSSLNFDLKKNSHVTYNDKGEPKHGQLTMGLALHAYDDKAILIKNDQEQKEINYTELPISKSGIIILLIIWQIGTYHLSARKKLKVE